MQQFTSYVTLKLQNDWKKKKKKKKKKQKKKKKKKKKKAKRQTAQARVEEFLAVGRARKLWQSESNAAPDFKEGTL